MISPSLLAVLLLATPAALPTPPGELPVDPYVVSNANAGAEPLPDSRVYEAFGGAEAISRIVDDMVERITTDPRIADIFRASDRVRLRRTLKEQFCYLLGGPCDYTGMPMRASHADHGITNAEFNALVENLQLAMAAEGVPFRAQNRLLALLAPMQREIVTR